MGFRVSTLGVLSALFLAFLQAPFLHVHEHVSTQHHPGPFLHAHFAHVQVHESAPELSDLDPDDDAVYQHWFSATQHVPLALDIVLCEIPVVPTPVQSGSRVEFVRPSAHDPPALVLLPPRSPPA